MQISFHLLARGKDVRDVRLFGLAQRRRHADDDGVAFAELREIGRRFELAVFDERGDVLGRHIGNVRAACVDIGNARLVYVKADGAQSAAPELDRQRQSYIPQPDHANRGASLADLLQQLITHSLLPTLITSSCRIHKGKDYETMLNSRPSTVKRGTWKDCHS